jgi:hypothetical protein
LALAAIIKVIDQQLMNPFNSSGANYAN